MSLIIHIKPMSRPKKIVGLSILSAVALLAVFLFSIITPKANAWPGCCSHHQGVCGCGCCDGSPLSATCAPHYPECNSPAPVPKPTPVPVTPTPIKTSTNNAQTDTGIDGRIKEKINAVKNDYPKYHEGFRESLIKDIIGMAGSQVDTNRIGYFVYTMLPDMKASDTAENNFMCNCSKTCPNISTCEEAQYQLNTCGCTVRDADHDGIACDNECQ